MTVSPNSSVFKRTTATLSGTIFARILTNGTMLATGILQIDIFFGRLVPQLFYGIYAVLLATANAFVYCYFATKTSHDLRTISVQIYASNWHKMDIRRQKETLMMIIFAQLGRNFDGFGIFYCNLETFLRV